VTLALRPLDAALAKRVRAATVVKAEAGGRDSLGLAVSRSEKAGYRKLRKDLLGRFEREFVSHLLRVSNNNISDAAAKAKIDRKHFWRLMQRNGIERGPPRRSPPG